MVGLLVGGAIAAGGSIIGGGISALGATSAAKTQADASKYAAQLAYQQYLTTRGDLSPYVQFGGRNLDAYSALPGTAASELTAANAESRANIPGVMSQDWLEQQPGYQFTKTQGQKNVESSAASRGLGVSGAAMGAGADFATGLAQKYYNTAFDQAQTRFTDYNSLYSNVFNKNSILNSMYSGQATLGANAAAQLGTQGTQTAGIISGDVSAAGQARAAGTATAASSIGNALSSASQFPLTAALIDRFGGLKQNPGLAPGTPTNNQIWEGNTMTPTGQ